MAKYRNTQETISEDSLFRMSFLLQDSNATTTKNYIRKIVESVLYSAAMEISASDETKANSNVNALTSNSGFLTISEIAERIQNELALEFSNNEIENAIGKIEIKNAHFIRQGNKISLSAKHLEFLKQANSVEDRLGKYVESFLNSHEVGFNKDDLLSLIKRYLYYSFNVNKDSLLALIQGHTVVDSENFKATDEEKLAINEFLSWDNSDKAQLIYQVVSSCYVYCSLTVKKDSLFSKKIFKDKRFYLDANIIFRLAGVNQDERQRTISSFQKKCNDLGIELLYTAETYDEIQRVIEQNVTWIKSVTNSQEPIDPGKYGPYNNDFYRIYIGWCRQSTNHYSDFTSFRRYLAGRIDAVLDTLSCCTKQGGYRRLQGSFEQYRLSLYNYKAENKVKVSTASSKTDVTNIFRILDDRDEGKGIDLFSTHTYLISADQNLIAWSEENFSGVPIAVLPSIWLTIMLRFAGRTQDDYQSFCSFMNLRLHSDSDPNIFDLISKLSENVSDRKTKERIIDEIVHHKELYPIDEEYIDGSIKLAFDEIRKQDGEAADEKLKESIAEISAAKDKEIEATRRIAQEEADRQKGISEQTTRERTIRFAVENELEKKIKIPQIIVNKSPWANIILVIVCGFIFIKFERKSEPIYTWIQMVLPVEEVDFSNQLVVLGGAWAAIMVVVNAVIQLAKNYVSKDNLARIRKKLRKKYTERVDDFMTEDGSQQKAS